GLGSWFYHNFRIPPNPRPTDRGRGSCASKLDFLILSQTGSQRKTAEPVALPRQNGPWDPPPRQPPA
ncbi:hypothetical protein, partial [Synechococcus sp. R5-12]|uniref:hypothetical protein n=1 Tax=Synechococcus sp. R5-12 TaxID=2421321 RepID=UPI0039C71D51